MKISEGTSKPASKFVMNMIYGISKSKDILLSSIAGALDEKTKKAYTSEKIGKRKFVNKIIKESKSLKTNVYLWFYQLAREIYNILSKTRREIKKWEDIRKTKEYDGQLCLL